MAHRWRTAVHKGDTTQRGYGTAHQKARAALAARHQPTDPCARCGHALGVMGPWLHLDHNDERTAYIGFSHGAIPCPVCGRKCNLRAGAQVGKAKSSGGRTPPLRW